MTKPTFYKDVPLTMDHTAEDVRVARAWLKAQRISSREGDTHNGIFCIVGAGMVVRNCTTGACHAYLSAFSTKDSTLLATLSHPLNRCNVSNYSIRGDRESHALEPDPVVIKAWYQWLVNESIYHRFIVATTTRQACENGLLITTSAPSNILAAICVMSRHVREHYGRVDGWYRLVQDGWDKDLAYLVSFGTNIHPKQTLKQPPEIRQIYSSDPGHSALPGLDKHIIVNFMARNFIHLNKPYRESNVYAGINSLYHPNSALAYAQVTLDQEIKEAIKALVTGEEIGKKEESVIPNPFGKAAPRRAITIIREDFIKYFRTAISKLYGVNV